MIDSAVTTAGYNPRDTLLNRNILIFGGTSGIGLEAAIQAKNCGANVTIVGSDSAKSQLIANQHNLNWLSADVTDTASLKQALTVVEQVDHLVLLAGTFSLNKVMETEENLYRRIFDERVIAAVTIISVLGKRLAADGSITLVSGVATHRATPHGTAVIAGVCAAIETFGRHLALELAPVRVNTISPGPIDTPLLTKSFGTEREKYINELATQVPLGRIGSAKEAADAVIFLMANQFMNGAVLNIDGGMNLT